MELYLVQKLEQQISHMSQTWAWSTWKNWLKAHLIPRISYLYQGNLVYSCVPLWFLSVGVRIIGGKLRRVSYGGQRFKTKNCTEGHGNPKPFSRRKCVARPLKKDFSFCIQYVVSHYYKVIANQCTALHFKNIT